MRRLLFATTTLLLLAGCNSGTSPTSEPAKPALTDLKIEDTTVGTGATAKNGDTLFMQYTGKLANGTVFDSTDKHGGAPFSFTLGAGAVIKGWDQGLLGMKEGGKRTLSIPAKLGYGAQDKGDIPPNSDLFFDVKLIKVMTAEDASTVKIKILKSGKGRALKDGDVVGVMYTGKLLDGTQFDSNEKPGGKPLVVHIGNGEVVTGFEETLRNMHYGDRVEATIPPQFGYGQQGHPPAIPPASFLVFDIEVPAKK